MTASWRLHLLGERAELSGPDGRRQLLPTAAWTLAILALDGPTPRERLAGLLWPDRPETRARANLRQALLRIRQKAPVLEDHDAALNSDVWVDVRDLEPAAWAEMEPAPVLGTLDAAGRPELGAWLAAARERVAERFEAALTRRIQRARAEGDLATASLAARRNLRLRPWSERACRTLMEIELGRGDPAEALRVFRHLRQALAMELDAAPTGPTLALAQAAARAAAERFQSEVPRPVGDARSLARASEADGWLEDGAELLRAAARSVSQPAELARLSIELAWLQHRLGRSKSAEVAARRALELLTDREQERSLVAEASFVLGSVAWSRGDRGEARACWRRALEHLTTNDGFAELRLRMNLALVEDALENDDAAVDHYRRAIELARATGDRLAEADLLNNLATLLIGRGHADAAVLLLRRALALARTGRAHLLEGYVLDSTASALLRRAPEQRRGSDAAPARGRNDVDAATSAAARAFTIATETGDARLQIEALLTLADAYARLGARDRAERCARGALRRAAEAGWRPLERAASASLRALAAGNEA